MLALRYWALTRACFDACANFVLEPWRRVTSAQGPKAVLNSTTDVCVHTLTRSAYRNAWFLAQYKANQNRVPGVCDCVLDTLQLGSLF